MWRKWWWEFDKEEPLQEDLVAYQRFMEFLEDRKRMDREKQAQKEKRKQQGLQGGTSTTYKIPDPINTED